ncbi:MAG: Ycf66 family protein [Prochlorococcaceae cyanobacterium]
MVNASLNWASIVGIVLAVGGAFLYFMRSFKPALARDYDVFFAAIGLLCGGILFFQGWRLDPILQFGQFLLAATTVFFAYESVRLRGVTTEQARRSSYFDDEEPTLRPRMGGGPDQGTDLDRFDEPQPLRRRIRSRDEEEGVEDFYRPRRSSRAAIPERAASRRPAGDWDSPERGPGRGSERGRDDYEPRAAASRFRAGPEAGPRAASSDFGSRRREREDRGESRRGSRPVPSTETMPRSSRRPGAAPAPEAGIPQGTPISRSNRPAAAGDAVSDADFSPLSPSGSPRPAAPRDNSSRFDD